uniref:Uncharacterized protein n=1 Tax=Glossina austeni TaxID=7395 RepID=A0A1A9VDX2_GLOAU
MLQENVLAIVEEIFAQPDEIKLTKNSISELRSSRTNTNPNEMWTAISAALPILFNLARSHSLVKARSGHKHSFRICSNCSGGKEEIRDGCVEFILSLFRKVIWDFQIDKCAVKHPESESSKYTLIHLRLLSLGLLSVHTVIVADLIVVAIVYRTISDDDDDFVDFELVVMTD